MERRISFTSRGNIVRGWAHIPEQREPVPAIIMCHGFTGNCSEHGLFDDFAREACKAGMYVLRIDCVGSGESDGSFVKYTSPSGWKHDIIAAIDFVGAQPEVDGGRIGTLGISMGAAAALLSLTDKRVLASVGWAPALYLDDVFRKIMGNENWKKLGQGLEIHHEYAGVEFDVAPCLRHDCETLSVEQVLRDCGKPTLLRLGTADPVIDPEFVSRIKSCHMSNVRVDTVNAENHGFMVNEQENIRESVDFLRRCLM